MIDEAKFKRRLLKLDETVLWEETISDKKFAKAQTKERRNILLSISMVTIFFTWVGFNTYLNAEVREMGETQRIFSVIFGILISAGLIWLFYFLIKTFLKPALNEEPRYYAITNTRLIAADEHGKLTHEMLCAEMELLVGLQSKQEILVSRKNDEDSENGFFIHFAEDVETARELIKKILRETI